jgi:hypothetical protein
MEVILLGDLRRPWLRRSQVLLSLEQRIGQNHRLKAVVKFYRKEGKYRKHHNTVVGSGQMA